MNELIERLRSFVVERGKIACGSDIVSACNNSALSLSDLRALLAALEAAREDAERWRQAFVDERASRYRADGMKIEQARIHAETDAEVAAIDQEGGNG